MSFKSELIFKARAQAACTSTSLFFLHVFLQLA